MRARQGKQPQKLGARSNQTGLGQPRAGTGLAGACAAVMLTLVLSSLPAAALAEQSSPGNSVKKIAAMEPALSSNTSSAPTSAQDLSLFGVLALGIIGLLWVRRHTSEL